MTATTFNKSDWRPWTQCEAISHGKKTAGSSYVNRKTGAVISRRQYQKHLGIGQYAEPSKKDPAKVNAGRMRYHNPRPSDDIKMVVGFFARKLDGRAERYCIYLDARTRVKIEPLIADPQEYHNTSFRDVERNVYYISALALTASRKWRLSNQPRENMRHIQDQDHYR